MKKILLFLLTLLLTAVPMLRADELTVNDGTTTNMYVPAYGSYFDTRGAHSQSFFSADQLADMEGGIISGITFYSSTLSTPSGSYSSSSWNGVAVTVSLIETTASDLSSAFVAVTSNDAVATLAPTLVNGAFVITFAEGYNYQGGNLVVDVQTSTKGSYCSVSWYGVATTGFGRYATSATAAGSAQAFAPKTTFEYEAAQTDPNACPNMQAPWTEEVNATDATIFWEEVEEVEFYQYVVVAKGEEPVWDEAEPIDMNIAMLEELEPATEYDFYVRTWCDDDNYGKVRKLSFKTTCVPVTTLPWSEDFDGVAAGVLALDCWENEQTVAGTGSSSGSVGLLFKVYTSAQGGNSTPMLQLPDMKAGTITVLSLPQMEIPAADAYQFKLDVYRADASTKTNEGVRIFANDQELGFISRDYATADEAHGIPAEGAAGWYTYELTIPVDGTVTIKIQGESQYGSSTFMDNLVVREIPACEKVSDIQFVSATTDAASFVWEGTSPEYALIIKQGNDTIVNTIVDSPEYTVEGLNHSTNYTYTLIVKGVCGEDLSDEVSKTISFTTECVALTIPFSTDFEGLPNGSTNGLPACWNKIQPASSYYSYISTSYATSGTQSLYMYGGGSSSNLYAILPAFADDVDLSGARIAFSYRSSVNSSSSYSSTYYGNLVVGVMSDPQDAATFVALDTLDQKSSFAEYELYLTGAPAGYHYVALCYKPTGSASSYSNYGAAYIDDLRISEIPTCFPGTKLHAVDSLATLTSVSFGWTPNVVENLNAHVIVKNGEAVIADAIVNDSVFTVTGLQSGTRYTFNIQVNTVCDGVDSPDALIGSLTMDTECEAKALPWAENFEDAASTALPVCWTKTLASGSYPSVSISSDALYFNGGGATSDQIVALPQVAQPLNELTLTLKYSAYVNTASTTYGTLKVGYYTDLAGEFVQVAELPQVASTTEEEVFLTNVPAEAQYLAIRYNGGTSNYGSAYVYELSLTETPSCLPVKSMAFSNVERRTLDIAWTPKVPAAAYDLVISDAVLDDAALAAAQVIAIADSATTYHATGLMRDTKYYVYVRVNCGAEDGASAWVMDSVKTKGLNVNDELFVNPSNGINSTYVPVANYYHNSYVQAIYTPADLQNYGATTISSIGLNYFYSTSMTRMVSVYMANVEESQMTSDYLRPENLVCVYDAKATTFAKGSNNWCDLTLDTPFDYAGGNLLVVFYMDYNSCETNYGSGARFYTHEASGKTRYTTSDTQTPGVLAPVNGLLSNTGSASTYRPNIRFDAQYAIEACPTVETVSHELLGDGTSSARISWTASNGDFANSYSVLYSETPVTDWTAVVPQIDSIQVLDTVISGLNAYTDYYVYVIAHCNGEGQNDGSSVWSEAYTFKTAADCPVIVDLAFAKTGRNTALATWKADYEDKNFVYVLSTVEMDEAALAAAATVAVTDTFVVFESLDYEQTYYLYVAHDCGEGAHSPYLVDSIHTSASCPAVENLHATATEAYTVLVAWESAEFAEETAWEVGVVGRESVAQTVAQKQALVIGLEADTDYTIYVKAICGEEESSALATLDVHTAAAPSDDATVGNGTASSSLVNTSWGNTYSQQIYTAAELNAMGYSAGKINSVAFNYTGTSSSYQKSQAVYIGTTGKDEFAGYTTADFVNLDLVYGPEARSYASGWQTYEFSTPFEWDGTSNIVVGVLTNQSGTNQSSAGGWTAAGTSLTSVYRAIEKHRDNAAIDITDLDAITYGARLAIRPNIKFGFEAQACPAAKGLAASDITTTSATLSWVPGAAEISWEVVVSATALTNDELEAAEKDVLTYQLSKQYVGLTPDVDYHFYVRSLCSEENGDWAHATFMTLPSCDIPTAIHVESTGLDTAVIAWSSEAAQFQVTYSNGEIENTVLVSDTNCVISGLNHSTIYTFTASVRAICAEGDSSRWSAPATLKFATECAPVVTLPWSEGFESFETGFDAGAPLCWNTINCNTGSSTTYPVVFVNTSSGYVHSGTQSLFFQSGANAHAIAILPEFADDLSGSEIVFWYRNESVSDYNGTLSVGYITDIADQNSFVALQTLEKTTTFTEVVQLLATIPAGARVAFDYVGGTNDNYYLAIDDVVIRPATTCFKVSNIHVVNDSTSTHSATIAWNAPEEGGDQFRVLIKNGEDVLVDNVLVQDTFCVVSGLNASTTYTLSVSVNTYCGEGDESEVVTKTVSFATDCEAISTFPWSDDFESYTTGSMNNAGCYSTESLQGRANDWEITSGASTVHSGSKCAYIKYSSSSAGRTVGALHLPEMLLEAGKNYEFKYWLKGSANASSDTIKVFMGETVLHNFNSKNDLGGNWNEITDTIVGTGEVVTLSFSFSNHDGYFAYLDDISVSEVHIPVLTYDTVYSLLANDEIYALPYEATEVAEDSVISALVIQEVITFADGVEAARDTTYLGVEDEVVLDRTHVGVSLDGTNAIVLTADVDGMYTFNYDAEYNILSVVFPSIVGTGIDGAATEDKAVKIIRNNQVYILRNGKIYDVVGRQF